MTYSFPHRHLIDTAELSRADIETTLSLADTYVTQNSRLNKKIAKFEGRAVVNLFFENSTRTRTSFELAAKRLGADVISIPVSNSSTAKGETFLDTAANLDAMCIDALVMRHSDDDAASKVSTHIKAHVLNAGAGKMAHPTQALLDAMTLVRRLGKLDGLNVAICGDVARSRVARSNIHLLKKFGANIRVIAPDYFMADDYKTMGVELFDNLDKGIADADAIIMLRIQHERPGVPGDFLTRLPDYIATYGMNRERLKYTKPNVLILHPGPINRGVELTDDLADDPKHSVIMEQVKLGVAVRMAALDLLMSQD